MALLRRRTPRDRVRMSDLMESFFDESMMRPFWRAGMTPSPFGAEDIPLDIVSDEGTVTVKAAVPGIEPDALHVEVEDDRVHIWGDIREDVERKDEDYYLREQRYGRLDRVATLPYAVDSEKAVANVQHGVLTLTLPKAPNAKHKEIKVQVKSG